jgi:hypothetical protein
MTTTDNLVMSPHPTRRWRRRHSDDYRLRVSRSAQLLAAVYDARQRVLDSR